MTEQENASECGENIVLAETLRFENVGHKEKWLQNYIYKNPGCLGLGNGEITSLEKERIQSGGGRMDMLLKDESDNSMYEVEVMLGGTDESHIIRTIEYWDRERRKWPQREHYAVLVAESVTSRFFNVIQLISHSIPIIGIQANILDVDGKWALNFVKVLDTFESREDTTGEGREPADEEYWRDKAAHALDIAESLESYAAEFVKGKTSIGYARNYIAVKLRGHNLTSILARADSKAKLKFRISPKDMDEAEEYLEDNHMNYTRKESTNKIQFTVTKDWIERNKELLRKLTKMSEHYWD